MAKKRRFRPAVWTIIVAIWDIWRRLPPQQRKQTLAFARRHMPTLAAQITGLNRRRSKKKLKKS